jgi:hypothetical protein
MSMTRTHNAGPRRGERGSAYIVVLLALVVLTIIGLSLVMITQTEVQLGANERTIARTFYAAESGLNLAAARALVAQTYVPFKFVQNESRLGNTSIADQIEVTVFAPIAKEPCDWCPVNDDGVPKFFKVNHAVTATARRVGWQGVAGSMPPTGSKVFAQSQLSVMFEFQPWRNPALESVSDPTQLAQIKF